MNMKLKNMNKTKDFRKVLKCNILLFKTDTGNLQLLHEVIWNHIYSFLRYEK